MHLDLMLCDHAEVSGGKLFVSGAGINRMLVPAGSEAPMAVNFAVAGVVTLLPAEAGSDRLLTFKVSTHDGRVPTLAGADGTARPVNGELGILAGNQAATDEQVVSFAFGFQGVPLRGLGQYVVVVEVDGVETRRVGFAVEAAS